MQNESTLESHHPLFLKHNFTDSVAIYLCSIRSVLKVGVLHISVKALYVLVNVHKAECI